MKKNKVWVKFTQNIAEDEKTKPFFNTVEFSDETTQAINAGSFSDWAICKARNFLAVERLQKHVGFKMNKEVIVELGVNGKQNKIAMKMSLNTERLQKALEATPELVAEVFTPAPTYAQLVAGGQKAAIAYITGDRRKTELAAPSKDGAAKPRGKKVLELQANETSVAGELLNGVLADTK